LRINQWIARFAIHHTPPSHRGWPFLRRATRTLAILDYWVEQTYNPASAAHARRKAEFTSMAQEWTA
jgi:hypothetical protein